MTTPPAFVTEYESAWNVDTTPKTASVTVATGDVLAIVASTADQLATLNTPTGGGLTYNPAQSVAIANFCTVYIWTVDPVAGGQTYTLSVTRSGSTGTPWGFNAYRFSDSDGIGLSSKTNVTSGAPTLDLTVEANSAIVVINSDWTAADGTVRTWRANAGALTEQTYFRDAAQYTTYNGYHADAGAAGTYAVGLSAPGAQKYSIAAVEIKGTSAAPEVGIPQGVLRKVPRARRVRR